MDFAKVHNQEETSSCRGRKPKCIAPSIRLMKDGDLIITYERHDSMDHLYLEANAIYCNKFGAFHHNDFIGKPFGSKIISRSTSRWVYALEPSPELWSAALHTRTQIVNDLDSSFILMNLDIHSGCVVVESGTGSGCFTNSLARAVYPHGHVYTFEYNAIRAEQAREEFQRLGVGELVTIQCQDVCAKFDQEGGGFPGVSPGTADAVFLDLPEPWLAVGHAAEVLKPGRNLCTYSPCIEQVIRTCEELRKVGFHSIHMYEVRHRPFDGRLMTFENAYLGRDNVLPESGLSTGSHISSSSANVEKVMVAEDSIAATNSDPLRQDERREEENNVCSAMGGESMDTQKRRKLDDDNVDTSKIQPTTTGTLVQTDTEAGAEGEATESIDNANSEVEKVVAGESSSNGNLAANGSTWRPKRSDHIPAEKYVHRIVPPVQMRVARPLSSMQGHTAFLTFALAPTEKKTEH